jgi:hypothetical protein
MQTITRETEVMTPSEAIAVSDGPVTKIAPQPVMAPEVIATKPNGPVAAGFIASGIGAFFIGLGVVLNEASATIKEAIGFDFNAFLKFDANFGLGKGVGPLSGKVTIAVVAFVITWAVLGYLWRSREVPFGRVFAVSLVLIGLGFLLTFPPIFEIFAAG